MIQMHIEIETVESGGVGVRVTSNMTTPPPPDFEGAIWVGICRALNEHLQERGYIGFDCMKLQMKQQEH